MYELQNPLNSSMSYQVMEQIHYHKISNFKVFEHSEKTEVIFMAGLMETKLSIYDEEIIT